ncbi:MAG: hypothetical protein M1814_001689 [Vezdaea aestivalis]|nr:MAG: hypothetical protein M1814_001689 [Vezdaea aestivalis]
MSSLQQYNPFSKKEAHGQKSVLTYKILTTLSWLLVVVSGFYYSFHAPKEGKYAHRTIFGQNRAIPTPFSPNQVIISIYWIVIWILQGGYVWHLFSKNTDYVTSAANVGSHFIFNNLLTFGWIMLWVRSHFWLSELLLIVNLFNVALLYFRHSNYARFIHIPVVSAPLAFNFFAIFWNGATMVHATTLPARILANIAIWGLLVYGSFFLVAFKDYTIGFELTILTAALGVGQFLTKVIAFQWIFAFVIMSLLFIFTLIIAVPGIFGKDVSFGTRGEVVGEDRERQPLLNDN